MEIKGKMSLFKPRMDPKSLKIDGNPLFQRKAKIIYCDKFCLGGREHPRNVVIYLLKDVNSPGFRIEGYSDDLRTKKFEILVENELVDFDRVLACKVENGLVLISNLGFVSFLSLKKIEEISENIKG